MSSRPRDSLPVGTVLDCYRITKLIGSGGFSLIYLAEDEDNHDEVAIKEYLPKRFGTRHKGLVVTVSKEEKQESFQRGRRLFYQEARVLATLRHPNIVHVRNCFLANNTAYLVMNYEPGKNLGRYIKKREGGLSTTFLMTVFPPLLDALELIHSRHQLHLDIKPSNVHLRPGGNPLLLDFGAVYHLDDVGEKKAQVVTPGFSPIEQYYASARVGPYTDVYAIGATMRACIEGKPPPSAVERHAQDSLVPAVEAFGARYPHEILESIDWAMQIEYANRPQTAAELRDALLGRTPVPKISTSIA
ncbi:MAG: serine/threonine protein kinase [Chromatiaceae bacterium]|nr:serine/threonine protein kinase [Gammaproteobacteria bacterium]MCP5305567.1 serine/threonine protein kinase [Chromatiaceae bacterium]MCP5315526.1 serine/threonine protein kinase [Chromatiaceae bacterium]